MKNYLTNLNNLPLNIRVLGLTSFVEGLISIGPLWSLYIVELKATLLTLGLFFSLFSFSLAVFQIPGGFFSDKFGRRKAIIYGGCLRTLVLIYFAFIHSWRLLIPGIILSSLATALIQPAKSALIAESVIPSKRGRTFGLIDTVQSATTVIGPALGLFLAGRINIKIVFIMSVLLSFISLLLNITYLEEKIVPQIKKRTKDHYLQYIKEQFNWFKDKNLNILLLSQGMSMFAASFAGPFFTLFSVKEIGVKKEKLAVIFALSNILLMFTRIPIGKIADNSKIKRKHLLIWGCLWGAVVWIMISMSHTYGHLFVYSLLAFAFVLPARSALISDMTLSKERASVFGALTAVDGLAGTMGYALAGVFAENYGMRLSIRVAGVGLMLSALFIKFFFKEKEKKILSPLYIKGGF